MTNLLRGSSGQRAQVELPEFPGFFFGFTLLVAVSRGAIQVAVGQSLAYLVQTVVVASFVIYVLLRNRPVATPWAKKAKFFVGAFVLVAIVSSGVSLWLNDIEFGLLLAAVMGFVAILIAGGASLDLRWKGMHRAGNAVVVVVLVQVAVATFQQVFNDYTLPGNTHLREILRPAALTGSYLHYPIVLALLSLALVGMYAAHRRWTYILTALIGMAAVILSQSRSGMVLVFVGLAVGTVFLRGLGGRLRILLGAVFAVATLLIAFPDSNILGRFLSIGVVEGSVNEIRVGIWDNVLDLWARSPLLIGSHTGEFTNVTNRLTEAEKAGITESGVLALLINFGILGLLTFYGLMITAVLSAPKRSWYQAALVAAIVQSFFYQSVEVFPFMVVFAMIPLIGRAFDADAPPRSPKKSTSADRHLSRVGRR